MKQLETKKYLAICSELIRSSGFTNVRAAEDKKTKSTKDLAIELYDKGHNPAQNDLDIADKTIAWAATLNTHGNTFLIDLKKVLSNKTFGRHMAGWVAAAITTMERESEKERRKEAEAKSDAASVFVGNVGNELSIRVKLVSKFNTNTKFGECSKHKWVDEKGNILVWWGQQSDYIIDNVYNIRAIVKNHNEYNGIKQTIISKVKLDV